MVKKLLFLMLFAYPLLAFNPQEYDLNRPVGSHIAVDLSKIEDEKYVLNILKKINKEIHLHPDDLELYILRNSYVYILWDISPKAKKKLYSTIGIKYADETIKKFPKSPDGWVRKGIFIGTYAITVGVLNVLKYAPEMIKNLQKAYQLNKRYYYAMPCQVLGRVYFKLPPFPLSYGDINKAARYLYEALKIAPSFAHIYVYLAELEAERGNKKLALKFLDKIAQIHPKTWYEVLIKKWTLRVLHREKEYILHGWNKYDYDFLTDPLRHMKK